MVENPSEHPIRCWLSFVLGLGGAAASAATIYALPVKGAEVLSCGIEALSCGKALTSDFSKVGGIPLGVFGVFYFIFWTLNLRAFHRTGAGIYRRVLSYGTLVGAIGSVSLAVIMFTVLKAPCLYCLLAHSCNLVSFALLWPMLRWKLDFRMDAESFWHFASLSGVALLGAVALYFANEVRHLEAHVADGSDRRTTAVQEVADYWTPVAEEKKTGMPEWPGEEEGQEAPAVTKPVVAEKPVAAAPEVKVEEEEGEVPELEVLKDYDLAQEKAKAEGKMVFLEFMSSRCLHCQRFKKVVLDTEEFRSFAAKELVVVIYDFSAREKQGAEVEQRFEELRRDNEVMSVPTFIVFSPEGEKLDLQTGWSKGVEKLLGVLGELR